MKPGQLIEYTLTNFIFGKSCTRCGGETIHGPFPKKSKLSRSLDHYSKVLHILFLLFSKLRTIEIDWPLAFTSYNFFFLKRRLELVFLPHFLHEKNICVVIFYYLIKFQYLVAFTSRDIGQNVYCNCLLIRLWRHKFWN